MLNQLLVGLHFEFTKLKNVCPGMSSMPFYSIIQIQKPIQCTQEKNWKPTQNKQKQKIKQNKWLSSKKNLIKPAMLIRMDTRHTQTYSYKTLY